MPLSIFRTNSVILKVYYFLFFSEAALRLNTSGSARLPTPSLLFLCIQFAPVYDLNRLQKLSAQIQKTVNNLNSDFYKPENTNLKFPDRIAFLQRNTLPEIKKLNNIAQQLPNIPLPQKQKK
jgi:hypothetical protein